MRLGAARITLLAVLLSGCLEGGQVQEALPLETGALEVMVLTDEWFPIAGATVRLLSQDGPGTPDMVNVTGEGGAVMFEGLTPGWYAASVTQPRFYPGESVWAMVDPGRSNRSLAVLEKRPVPYDVTNRSYAEFSCWLLAPALPDGTPARCVPPSPNLYFFGVLPPSDTVALKENVTAVHAWVNWTRTHTGAEEYAINIQAETLDGSPVGPVAKARGQPPLAVSLARADLPPAVRDGGFVRLWPSPASESWAMPAGNQNFFAEVVTVQHVIPRDAYVPGSA